MYEESVGRSTAGGIRKGVIDERGCVKKGGVFV